MEKIYYILAALMLLILTSCNVYPPVQTPTNILPSNVPVNAVTLTPVTVTINVGETRQHTATVVPANATNQAVTWSSSNTEVATVDASGLVTGVSTGSAAITALTADGAFNAISAITVTVEYVWKFIEIVNHKPDNIRGNNWSHDFYLHAPGDFSFRFSHGGWVGIFEPHTYATRATWGTPPKIIKKDEMVLLTVDLFETENTHSDVYYFSSSTWASFAFPTRSISWHPFANTNGETSIVIYSKPHKPSASDTFTSVAPAGSPGERMSIRLEFYHNETMSTDYIYEWQSAGVTGKN